MVDDVVLQADGLSKDYRLYAHPRDRLLELAFRRQRCTKFRALDNVTFALKRGDVVGILGRNGAGKSTLLKLLTGVLSPDEGRAVVRGSVSSILELGVGINPEYSGRENARLGALARGVPPSRLGETLDRIIEFSELAAVIDNPLKTYSSGMQARLLFSTAIAVEADVMIIDEALAAGDALFQEKCLQRMHALAKSGRTILFVSHSIDMVQQLCNRAMLLHKGKLLADGDISMVTHEYHELLARERAAVAAAEVPLARTDGDDVVDDPNLDGCITQLTLCDGNDRPVPQLHTGQRYRARLHLRCYKDIEHAYVGFRIYLPSGLVLFATSNTMLGHDISMRAGDSVEVSFDFTCHLQAGVYLLGCGLGRLTDLSAGLYPAPFQPLHVRNGVREVFVAADHHFGGLFDMAPQCRILPGRPQSTPNDGISSCQVASS